MIDPTNCSLLIQTTQTNRKKKQQTNKQEVERRIHRTASHG